MLNRELAAFLRGSVRSVWAVELLLILRRPPRETWSAQDLVRELRGSPALVAENLRIFEVSGVVQQVEPDRYAYRPASAQIDGLCDALEQEYRRRPAAVMQAIVAGADKVQGLADAFRIKEGDT